MGDPVTQGVLLASTLAVSGAATGYQIYSSEEAAQKQKEALRKNEEAANQLIADKKAEDEKTLVEEQSLAAREASRSNQEANKAGNKLGRASTILTSPLGVPETKNKKANYGKTILGA